MHPKSHAILLAHSLYLFQLIMETMLSSSLWVQVFESIIFVTAVEPHLTATPLTQPTHYYQCPL